MAIRCAHCKGEVGKGRHDTVAQVKLCSVRHQRAKASAEPETACTDCPKPATVWFAPNPADVMRVPFCDEHLPTTTSDEQVAEDMAWKQRFADREAEQERAVYQHMVDTNTV